VLGWAAALVADHDWFIQKAIAWWLRDLSRHDAQRTRDFMAQYGDQMKPFARKEALAPFVRLGPHKQIKFRQPRQGRIDGPQRR
jgi:3-methyladenine DNA glycosylase AlkD